MGTSTTGSVPRSGWSRICERLVETVGHRDPSASRPSCRNRRLGRLLPPRDLEKRPLRVCAVVEGDGCRTPHGVWNRLGVGVARTSVANQRRRPRNATRSFFGSPASRSEVGAIRVSYSGAGRPYAVLTSERWRRASRAVRREVTSERRDRCRKNRLGAGGAASALIRRRRSRHPTIQTISLGRWDHLSRRRYRESVVERRFFRGAKREPPGERLAMPSVPVPARRARVRHLQRWPRCRRIKARTPAAPTSYARQKAGHQLGTPGFSRITP